MKIKTPKPLKEYRAKKYAKLWKDTFQRMYWEVQVLIQEYHFPLNKKQHRAIAYNTAILVMDLIKESK